MIVGGTDRADVRVPALVDVLAVVGGRIAALARRTLAGEGTRRVDASAAGAEPRHGGALVYVLALARVQVAQVAMRTVQLPVATLARVAPGAADGGAAQLLRANDALERANTQRAAPVRVARTCAPVQLAARARQPGEAHAAVRRDASPAMHAGLAAYRCGENGRGYSR